MPHSNEEILRGPEDVASLCWGTVVKTNQGLGLVVATMVGNLDERNLKVLVRRDENSLCYDESVSYTVPSLKPEVRDGVWYLQSKPVSLNCSSESGRAHNNFLDYYGL